jgi:hypothetical protein
VPLHNDSDQILFDRIRVRGCPTRYDVYVAGSSNGDASRPVHFCARANPEYCLPCSCRPETSVVLNA